VPPATHLARIVAAHRARAQSDRRAEDELAAEAVASPAPRPFARRLSVRSGDDIAVIAEIKRRSPSKGVLAGDLDPATTAADYEAGGAACLSVLTDEEFFGGSPADLRAAKTSCALPVLRKDFTVSPFDLYDARIMGADAVLLIVAALSDDELVRFVRLAGELSLDALVEVHDADELTRALRAGATLVGVNQRDLATFDVDTDRARTLAASIPGDVVAVAESGVRGPDDVARLADAGFQAVLVGESLVRSADRRGALSSLLGHRVGVRNADTDRSGAATPPPPPGRRSREASGSAGVGTMRS
jgi:indole-3-glycerol phosphate synthase